MDETILDSEKIFSDFTPKVRSEFERIFADELKDLFASLNRAIIAEMEADKVLTEFPKGIQKQKALSLAVARKAINDIMGALESFRSGYFDLAQGGERSSLEGFATAVLINEEAQVAKEYFEGRFSVNDSVNRMLRHKKFKISEDEAKQFRAVYSRMHGMTHPSRETVMLMMQSTGVALGGHLSMRHDIEYRSFLAELSSLASNLEAFIKKKFSKPEKS